MNGMFYFFEEILGHCGMGLFFFLLRLLVQEGEGRGGVL